MVELAQALAAACRQGVGEISRPLVPCGLPESGWCVRVRVPRVLGFVADSGADGFASASGRVDFKDIIGATTITYDYRGHIRLA